MTAVVTGGGRGIGLAVSEMLLDMGYTVIIASRSESDEVKKLKDRYAERVCFITLDISDLQSIKNAVKTVEAEYGKIDLLVNDAGIAPKIRKDILEINEAEFNTVVDTNLKGTFFVSQGFAPLLMKNEKARIVNISSLSSYTASVSRGEYCISKAGISMVTKLFAVRLAESGVSVFEIRPGIIDTDMTRVVKNKYEKMIAEGITPIRRMGKPEDIAKCIRGIAAGDMDYCTGTVIECDGGFSVRTL